MFSRSKPHCERSEIDLDGKTVFYNVKISLKARHVRLEVRPETGLTVVLPKGYQQSKIPQIILDKKRWIKTKLELYDRAGQKHLEDGGSLRYLGRELRTRAVPCDGSDCTVRLAGDELLLQSGTDEDNRMHVESWLKKQASVVISELAERHSLKIGVKYNALRIRSARTRWGSCSPHGNLNFNWKLIMVPLPVIEYVVIHELCHLKELNHSKAFWKLVENYCPDWRKRRKWLRDNETALAV